MNHVQITCPRNFIFDTRTERAAGLRVRSGCDRPWKVAAGAGRGAGLVSPLDAPCCVGHPSRIAVEIGPRGRRGGVPGIMTGPMADDLPLAAQPTADAAIATAASACLRSGCSFASL